MNTSLFLETVSHLKKDPQKINHYCLTDPHLLYLSSKQSNAYIGVTKNDKYYNTFHKESLDIIHSNLGNITPTQGTFSLIDLGPGYPDKSLPIAHYMKKKGTPIAYYPVDISPSFLNLAEEAMSDFVSRVTPIQAHFAACPSLIPPEVYLGPVCVMLGVTFMNFEPNVILPLLKKIAGEKGCIILAAELLTQENSAEDIVSRYDIEECETLAFGPLANLGIKKEWVRYLVEFDRSRIECKFVMNTDFANEKIKFKKGDTIITTLSYRYSLHELQKLLKENFTSSHLYLSESHKTTVAICS